MKTYNQDLVSICQRIDRFREELIKSVSSGTSQLNEFDRSRLVSYLGAINGIVDWCVSQPQLDLPESHPREYTIEDGKEEVVLENEMINDIVRMLDVARDELVNSQSSRRAASLISFDVNRVKAMLIKVADYLNSYVDTYTPLDLPESSPRAEMSGHGKKGI
jgi:hypothetical protein